MVAAGWRQKNILCFTDAFIKYAMVMPIENKEGETVTKAVYSEWFCKFYLPIQINTDRGEGGVYQQTVIGAFPATK